MLDDEEYMNNWNSNNKGSKGEGAPGYSSEEDSGENYDMMVMKEINSYYKEDGSSTSDSEYETDSEDGYLNTYIT